MPEFSQTSEERLKTCHPDIVAVCRELIKQYDFAVLCGHRNEAAQNAAYDKGNSHVRYPKSAHNKTPSLAVDIVPYPVDWENLARFRELIYRFDAVACVLRGRGEIKAAFEYGAFWPEFKDYPHIEIKEK